MSRPVALFAGVAALVAAILVHAARFFSGITSFHGARMRSREQMPAEGPNQLAGFTNPPIRMPDAAVRQVGWP